MTPVLPYRIAVLAYLFDAEGRLLLLHRRKPPNLDLYSPIGGKLEQATGESPTACAVREIAEETGLHITAEQLHLTGIVSERGYEGQGHWLMFLYEVTSPVTLAACEMDEGRLEWHRPEEIDALPIPETDRDIIWPAFWKHRGGFFMAHIDCDGPKLVWDIEQSTPAPGQNHPAPTAASP